ncbi:hypothetical protein THICB3470053 [Thiomonas sp. CB3]|nr:hypothetical protein THICB3470053 [Thiomonas sp. CB3]
MYTRIELSPRLVYECVDADTRLSPGIHEMLSDKSSRTDNKHLMAHGCVPATSFR